jgi:hypothetical protein
MRILPRKTEQQKQGDQIGRIIAQWAIVYLLWEVLQKLQK